jgi:hypothetical protein
VREHLVPQSWQLDDELIGLGATAGPVAARSGRTNYRMAKPASSRTGSPLTSTSST